MRISNNEDNPVIMVDDNEADIFLAHECFQESPLPHPWLSFTSGAAFLAHLGVVKAGDAPMPALVLLDVNMPQMSGHDVLRQTRDDPHFAALPIFCMLTSSSDPRDRQLAEETGASGFVTKPDDPDEYVRFFASLMDA